MEDIKKSNKYKNFIDVLERFENLSPNYKEEAFKEIEKCALLCSNCQHEFHYLESKEGLLYEDFLKI